MSPATTANFTSVSFATIVKERLRVSKRERENEGKRKVRIDREPTGRRCVRTSMPRRFLHRTHLLNPGRQYSTKYSSVYSTPWPLPNLPWVLVDVSIRGLCRFTSRYSLPSFVTIFFGHQAPPPLSCLSLRNQGITVRIITEASRNRNILLRKSIPRSRGTHLYHGHTYTRIHKYTQRDGRESFCSFSRRYFWLFPE